MSSTWNWPNRPNRSHGFKRLSLMRVNSSHGLTWRHQVAEIWTVMCQTLLLGQPATPPVSWWQHCPNAQGSSRQWPQALGFPARSFGAGIVVCNRSHYYMLVITTISAYLPSFPSQQNLADLFNDWCSARVPPDTFGSCSTSIGQQWWATCAEVWLCLARKINI